MAQTNSERQAKYKRIKVEKSGKRLDMMVDSDTRFYIDDLCHCYTVTQKELIEKLVLDAAVRAEIACRQNHQFLELLPCNDEFVKAKNKIVTV
jgi:hypothetical protein